MSLSLSDVARLKANPVAAMLACDAADAEEKLADFVRLTWPILEPATPLVWSWPMDAICEHLEAVSAGQIQRLLINCPPGFSKSLLTNVFWPAWEWLSRPHYRYISWSYNEALTIRDNRRCRRLLESPLFQGLWGQCEACRRRPENAPRCAACEESKRLRLSGDQNAKIRYDNDWTGWRIATSVHGMGTGERGDRNIWDDPHNVKGAESDAKREAAVQWWAETLPTRVNDASTSAEVGIMQRLHELDISGHILAGDFGYEHLLIEMEYEGTDHPARKTVGYRPSTIGYHDPREESGEVLACPERFPADEVEKLKAKLRSWGGEYAEAGQLRQWPIQRGGGMFKAEWFDRIVDLSEAPTGRTVRGWDLAGSKGKTSPFTASVKLRLGYSGSLYVLDVTCERIDAAELEDYIARISLADDPDTVIDVPQDPGQAGKVQVSSLAKRLHGRQYQWSPETGSKEVRAQPFASQCKAKNVILVRGDWNRAYVNEAKSFPRGQFKDRVDATSRAYAALISGDDDSPIAAPILTIRG